MDSDGGTRTAYAHRAEIKNERYWLFVKVRDLQFEDSGVYWVGIDKMYADIMASVNVVITEGKNKVEVLITDYLQNIRQTAIIQIFDLLLCVSSSI